MPQNILVGDIGSTKSTWWSNSEGNKEFHLTGYNPIAHEDEAGRHMFEQLWQVTAGDPFDKIWYYGAGVINEEVADKIKTAVKKYFPSAQIEVGSDLLGAAKAACHDQEGTLVILGTGSHAAVYDGKRVIRQATSLGYLLGDEGGGCDIGKELITAYFYQQMPADIAADMQLKLIGGRSEFLQQLYHHPTPNQFLAEFVKVAIGHHHHAWIQNLVKERFTVFIQNHLLPIDPIGQVHVIGSVGTIFAGLLRTVLEEKNLTTGVFIQNPARRLFEMHLQHE